MSRKWYTPILMACVLCLSLLVSSCETMQNPIAPQSPAVSSQKPGPKPARLAADPRVAIKLECFYSLNQGYGGGSNQNYNGYVTSDWSYMLNDPNAYGVVKGWYGSYSSIWTGWPSFYTNMDVYSRTNLNRFGQNQGVTLSHGGQCKYYANLILYRSATFQQKLPVYEGNPAGYRPYSQIRIGDIIETTWANGHTAVVVGIVSGVEGQSVTAVTVVDSNFIGDEVIGKHNISYTGGGGVSDLGSYHALILAIS